MLKKTIAYVDYNDEECSDVFYFNLTKTELVEMEASVERGMGEMLTEIAQSENAKEMLAVFKEIILRSVGRKSEDGKRFSKSEDFALEFVESPAFDALFMELMTDADRAVEFIKGIIPRDLAKDISGSNVKDFKAASVDDIANLKAQMAARSNPSLEEKKIAEVTPICPQE